jgi:phage-related protein
VIRVRVASRNLRRDIREAVNDGFRGADSDIDARGREVGEKFNDSVAKGLRQDEKIRQSAERLQLAIARNLRDDQRLQLDAERHGLRVTESVAKGMRDEERLRQGAQRLNDNLQNSMSRALRDDRRLDLAGERLANQLQSSIERGLRDDRRMDQAGLRDAQRWSDSVARGLRDDRRIEIAGDALSHRMSESVARGLRDDERLRIAGERLNQQIADGVRRSRALDLSVAREARLAGEGASRNFGNGFNRDRNRLRRVFSAFGNDMGKELASEFRLGIGAGRPGPAIVSMLALAAPGAIGSAAALGVAMAGALTAAVSSTLLSGGLLAAAFASGAESLTVGKDIFKEAGTRAGTLIADGMAAGFTASANIFQNTILPAIEGPLARTGEAFGRMFEGLGNTLASTENVGRIGRILEQNIRFIDQFGAGLSGLTTSFLTLFAASQPMIELVGSKFQEFGEWAASALAAAEANGSLGIVMDKLTRLADAMFGWLAKIGPAFGDWLLNLDVERIISGWEAFGRILGDIFTLFGQIAEGAGPHFVVIMDNIHQILSNLVNSGVLQTVADRVGYLLERFTAFIAELTSSELGATIGTLGLSLLLFGGFISPIVTLLSALGSALTAIAGAVGVAIAPILIIAGLFAAVWTQSENFRLAIEDLVAAISGKFLEIWDEISPKIQPLIDNFLLFAHALGERLVPIIEFIGPIFLRLMDIIGTVLGFIIDQVGEFFGFLGSILTGDFEAAWDHFLNLWSNLFGFLGDIFTEIRLLIGSVFSGIWEFLVGIWDSIFARMEMWLTDSSNAINTAWTAVKDFFIMIWNAIWQFFEDRWTEIVAGFVEMGVGFRDWWNNLWDWASEKFMTIWNAIWAFFETILTALADAVRAAGTWIQEAWNNALTWVRDTAVNIWNAIWAFFENILTTIANGVRAAGNWIQDAWNAALSWVRDTAVSIWNGIWGFIEGILTSIADGVRSAGNAIQTAWNSALSWVRDTAVNIWNGILSFLSGIWDSIAGAASTAFQAVYNAIVQPIIDAYNTVVGWITNIKDAIAGLLGDIGSAVTEANEKLGQVVTAQAEATAALPAIAQVANNPLGGALPAQLARGGIIQASPGGIHAVVGEGRNNERIEPLDSQGLSRRDRALITQIINTMTPSAGGQGDIHVQVMVGDQELRSFVSRVVDAREGSLARQIQQRRRS